MTPPESAHVFGQSLERCLADRSFTQRFYARFLLAHDEVAARFHGVDMLRQSKILRTSLYLVLRAAMGHRDGVEHLEEVAETHSQRGYAIPPHLYEKWVDCLVEAARETDPEFGPETSAHWRAALAPCIAIMTQRDPRE